MDHQPLFTGRQITTIAVAVAAAIILAPVGVMAASGSLVNIADPGHPSRKAHVTAAGALQVAPQGTQKVSGTVKVSNVPATQKVSGTVKVSNVPATQKVSGAVTAEPGLPGLPFARTGDYNRNHPLTVPAGKHFVIQTLSVLMGMTTPSKIEVEVDYTSGGSQSAVYVPLTKQFTDNAAGVDLWEGTEGVNLYADPGSKVYLTIFPPEGTVQIESLAVSGYLA
jgi:hypothetical protein